MLTCAAPVYSDYDHDPLLQKLLAVNDKQKIAEMLRATLHLSDSEVSGLCWSSESTQLVKITSHIVTEKKPMWL
jgi:hypothetical protein